MKIYNKQNVNKLETAIIKSAKSTDFEIEKAISNPELFENVLTRIKSEQSHRKRIFSANTIDFLKTQKTAFASIVFLAILTTFLAMRYFQSEDRVSVENIRTESASVNDYADIPLEVVKSQLPKTVVMTKSKASFNSKNRNSEIGKASKNRKIRKVAKKSPEKSIDGKAFYALYPGDDLQINDDIQIIRTRLSGASLSSLGITGVSFDDDREMNADLLIDTSGRPRAIRFINQ